MFTTEFLITFLKTAGYLGIFGITFAESGLLIGFFLPGDSLLFTAGLLASQQLLDLPLTIITIILGAVLGDNVGYSFGKKIGKKIFDLPNSKLFNKDNLIKAEIFYEEHGPKTIILARFIPFIRTFAPIIAGVSNMNYKTFLFYNLTGGITWAVLLPVFGFYLGKIIPDIDKFILPILIAIIFISILPALFAVIKSKLKKSKNN